MNEIVNEKLKNLKYSISMVINDEYTGATNSNVIDAIMLGIRTTVENILDELKYLPPEVPGLQEHKMDIARNKLYDIESPYAKYHENLIDFYKAIIERQKEIAKEVIIMLA